MDTTVIIAIVAAVLVVGVVIAVAVGRRRQARQLEEARYRASETRDLAEVARAEAAGHAAEAQELVARAERERLAAEQAQLEAEHKQRVAADLHAEADEVDPDVEIDLDAEPSATDRIEVDHVDDHADRR